MIDQTVKIWDVEAGRSIQTWRLSEEGDVSVPDHQVGVAWPNRSDGLILSLSLSGNINYLAEGTPKPRRILYGHQKNITTLASFPSPPTLWTGSSDGRICNWDVSSGTGDTVDGEQHSNYVSGLSLTPSSLSTVGWDDTLRTIDTSARTFTGTKESTEGQPIGVVTLENGTTITTTHKGIQVFKPGSTTVYLPTPNFSPTSVSATTSLIAVGGDDGALHIYTISSSSLSELTKIPSSSGSGPTVLSFSPDGSKLAAGFSNGKISVYDVSSTKGAEWDISISRWSAHTGRVSSIVWRKDGKFAVSGALDTNVFVWSVDKPGKRIKAEGAHKEGVNAVGWVGESKVVTAGMDAAIRVWDVGGLE